MFSVRSLCSVDGTHPRCPPPLTRALRFSFWLLLLLCAAVAPSLLLAAAGCLELLLLCLFEACHEFMLSTLHPKLGVDGR